MKRSTLVVLLVFATACGDDAGVDEREPHDAAVEPERAQDVDAGLAPDAEAVDGALTTDAREPEPAELPYARALTRFTAGANAGFGANKLPEVVLGPPKGGGTGTGSLDVLSLGTGGEIVLDFGEGGIVDGPGPDFIVFENAFWPDGQAASVFAEPAEVSVSNDDLSWSTFVCNPFGAGMGRYPGCAGWTPTLQYDAFALVPLDPALTGGDAFDLAALSLSSARYVRVRDLATKGEGSTAGFDLDAVGVIHSTTGSAP